MGIYINGIGSVSPLQINTRTGEFRFETNASNRLACHEPDYKDLVPPMQLRRMSRVVKIGMAAARQALQDAAIETPDIITLGTAYGCLADTELFLNKMLTQGESMLTPTSFIQSTHNTVSGQIALATNCYGHNFTYVHRGHSFESALQESMLWLKEEDPSHTCSVLTGGVDELTDHSYQIISRFGTYRSEPEGEGCIAGEGANLFILSNQKTQQSYAELLDVHLCQTQSIQKELTAFLHRNECNESDIDICLLGLNGNPVHDHLILENISLLDRCQRLVFKPWCGEYPTSGSFALMLASTLLRHQHIPEELYHSDADHRASKPQRILIYNHYKNRYHSFSLVRSL